MNNPLKYLVIHCTAEPAGRDTQPATVEAWHRAKGWTRPGYRCLITLDGTAHRMRPANRNAVVEPDEVTWGVGPAVNPVAHHICYVGGLSVNLNAAEDTRTLEQLHTMELVVRDYLSFAPDVLIAGHNQFDNKACPSFDVPEWCELIGIPDRNIYRADPYGYRRMFMGFPPNPKTYKQVMQR